MSGKGAGRGRGRGRGRAGSPKKKTTKATTTTTKKGKVGPGGSKGGSRVEGVAEREDERRSGSEADHAEEERQERLGLGLSDDDDRVSEVGEAGGGAGPDKEGEEGLDGGAGESWSAERMRVETKIAEFFEARPYFYDKKNDHYKKTQMRNAEMAELVKELGKGWTRKCLSLFWNRIQFSELSRFFYTCHIFFTLLKYA